MNVEETLLNGIVHHGCVDAGYTNADAIVQARAAVSAWRQRGNGDASTVRGFAADWLTYLGIDAG